MTVNDPVRGGPPGPPFLCGALAGLLPRFFISRVGRDQFSATKVSLEKHGAADSRLLDEPIE